MIKIPWTKEFLLKENKALKKKLKEKLILHNPSLEIKKLKKNISKLQYQNNFYKQQLFKNKTISFDNDGDFIKHDTDIKGNPITITKKDYDKHA